MPLLSRLNCFSSKKKKSSKKNKKNITNRTDDAQTTLLSQVESSPGGSSSTSRISSHLSTPRSPGADDNSIPTMDSDYNNIQASNFSLSDAGGTLGSQNQSLSNFSQAASALGFGSPGGASTANSSLAGNSTEQRRLYNDYYYGHLTNTPPGPPNTNASNMITSPYQQREEILEIYAPSGKLGIVVDTPPTSSTPIVHAIKDTCPIRAEVYVGDKLVAVDGIDVREMEATDVSKLIGSKSGQSERKLTIIRSASKGY